MRRGYKGDKNNNDALTTLLHVKPDVSRLQLVCRIEIPTITSYRKAAALQVLLRDVLELTRLRCTPRRALGSAHLVHGAYVQRCVGGYREHPELRIWFRSD